MAENIAIVTGGGGNIGRGACRALAKAGITPIAVDLDPSGADAAARQIVCDVADPDACADAVADVVREFGGVDTLFNAAQGVIMGVPLAEMAADDLRFSFETGPVATMRMMQLCYPHFKARGGGAVVNFASASGTRGTASGSAAYSAAKEAIRGLTKTAAMEWGKDNIRVNVVCPLASADAQPNQLILNQIPNIPLGRLGDPEKDVGPLLVYLASPDCFMTGRTLFIDGGQGTWR
jgi:NAD(P)-dependent dehydrogenase (short-subunit alcohol dehydrogenase family)